jgi:hypothetical protein
MNSQNPWGETFVTSTFIHMLLGQSLCFGQLLAFKPQFAWSSTAGSIQNLASP